MPTVGFIMAASGQVAPFVAGSRSHPPSAESGGRPAELLTEMPGKEEGGRASVGIRLCDVRSSRKLHQ